MGWSHSGFNVFCGPRIQPGDEEAMENLARYIIRASFSQERMTYIPEDCKVVYESKDGEEEKIFDALEWLAAMCSHISNKGEQTVRYLGYYSNVACGKRKKSDQDELIPSILEPDGSSNKYRRNWARLIQNIYETDPLCCPRCFGKMKVISVIEDEEIIRKILKHLGLWDINPPELWRVKARPPPRARLPPKIQNRLFHIPAPRVYLPSVWLVLEVALCRRGVSRGISRLILKMSDGSRGYVYPNFLNFLPFWGKQPSRRLVHIRHLHLLNLLCSPLEMHLQHHEVDSGLTHNGESRIV